MVFGFGPVVTYKTLIRNPNAYTVYRRFATWWSIFICLFPSAQPRPSVTIAVATAIPILKSTQSFLSMAIITRRTLAELDQCVSLVDKIVFSG